MVKGLEAALTANPSGDWRMRLVGAWTDGKIGTSTIFPVVYNDQFYANPQGVVTYRDGTPVYINPTAINTTTPVLTATTAGAVPLTIAMMNSPTNLYYANPVAVTGQITSGSNAARVLRVIDPVRGPILTGATGLPISAIQINPGFSPPSEVLVGKSGDITVGHPEFSLSFTNMYTFSQGYMRGFRVGGTAAFSWENRGYYYYPVAATPTSNRQLYMRGDRVNFNAIAGYTRRFGKYSWSTQVNVSNLFNNYDVKVLPASIGGYNRTANAVFEAQPRSYIWTNTISF
jgi:hypothetical protein